MRLSVLISSVAAASAVSVPRGPHGGPKDGYATQNQSAVVPALYESDTKCVYPVPDPKFKVEKYLGRWFQVAGTPFRETTGARCVSAQYTALPNGIVGVENTSIGPNNQPTGVNGTASPVDAKRYGKGGAFIVEFPRGYPSACPGPNYIVQEFGGEYSIVQTANWGVLYILARERNPPAKKVDQWIESAVKLGSNATAIIKYDQTNCE